MPIADADVDGAPREGEYVYTCNTCNTVIETRYHCTVCEDFDMCMPCFDKNGHPHDMEKLQPEPGPKVKAKDPPPYINNENIHNCIQSLMHASECPDKRCDVYPCRGVKRIIFHIRHCKIGPDDCKICKRIVAFSYFHAKRCYNPKCLVPFCRSIKKLKWSR